MTPNYDKAVWESIRLLDDCDFNTLPINLNTIFKRYRLTINKVSYTKLSKKLGVSVEEVCDLLETDLGACEYEEKTERYIIYYNDTKHNYGLDRFTIAHELGHIFLGHHAEINSNIILRKNITEEQYDKIEKEASCFARNLLAPLPLVDRTIDMDTGFIHDQLQSAFEIGFIASKVRYDAMRLDRYRMNSSIYEYFNTYEINFDHYCTNCRNAEIEDSNYCKICGLEYFPFIDKVHGKFYDGIETNEDNRVITCPVCDNEEFTEGLYYCKICGTERYNYCSDYENCGQVNDGNARYCKDCGSKTVFFNKGLLEKIK